MSCAESPQPQRIARFWCAQVGAMKRRGVLGEEKKKLIEDGCSQARGSSQMTLPTCGKFQTPPKLAPPAASRFSPLGCSQRMGTNLGGTKKKQPKVLLHRSANKGLPLPLGRRVCETKSKNGRSRPRKPFISRVFCAQRGIETMVSDHGLGRGQTKGWG